MPYRLMGRLHAGVFSLSRDLRAERGQGTVEYVALILLLAAVFAAVVTWGADNDMNIGDTIVNKLKGSIEDVGKTPGEE